MRRRVHAVAGVVALIAAAVFLGALLETPRASATGPDDAARVVRAIDGLRDEVRRLREAIERRPR